MGLWWKIGLLSQRLFLEDICRKCERTDVLRTDDGRREARALSACAHRCLTRVAKMSAGRCSCGEPLDIHTAVRIWGDVMHAMCAVGVGVEP